MMLFNKTNLKLKVNNFDLKTALSYIDKAVSVGLWSYDDIEYIDETKTSIMSGVLSDIIFEIDALIQGIFKDPFMGKRQIFLANQFADFYEEV